MTPLEEYADSLIDVEGHAKYGKDSKNAHHLSISVSRQGVGPGGRPAYYAEQRAREGFGILS
jgi:hypothetical protein